MVTRSVCLAPPTLPGGRRQHLHGSAPSRRDVAPTHRGRLVSGAQHRRLDGGRGRRGGRAARAGRRTPRPRPGASVGTTNPSVPSTLRRKLPRSGGRPQTAAYTRRSSGRVNGSATNSSARVVYSSLARIRSTASRRISAWSKARAGASGPVGEQVVDRPPARPGGVGAGRGLGQVGGEGDVGDRHDPHPRVAVGRRVGAQLLEVTAHVAEPLHPGLLVELAPGGLLGVLVGLDEPARSAQEPAYGSTPRSTSSTEKWPSRIVKTARSTVTANGGCSPTVGHRPGRLHLGERGGARRPARPRRAGPGSRVTAEPGGARVEDGRAHAVVGGDPDHVHLGDAEVREQRRRAPRRPR